MRNSDYYQFSSLVPKVKKSIKKYKNQYNREFLNKIQSAGFNYTPPKFLQPIIIYRFFGDFVTIDNPEIYSGNISQLSFFLTHKSISKITIKDRLTVHLADDFSKDSSSVDLYIDRLKSLGNLQAFELAKLMEVMKEYFQIKDESSNINSFYKNHFNKIEDLLSKEELVEYHQMKNRSDSEMSTNENCFTFRMKKFFIKKVPYLQYGSLTNKIEFNQKIILLFMNKELKDLSYDDVFDLFNITSIKKENYFQFFSRIVKGFQKDDCEIQGGMRTVENIELPSIENLKFVNFNGKNYEENHIIITFKIEEKYIDNLFEIRRKNREKELNKINLEKAILFAKYKRIPNVESDSWKTLCLLYYGNSDELNQKKEEKIEFDRNYYWENIDQSKVCRYRYLKQKPKDL